MCPLTAATDNSMCLRLLGAAAHLNEVGKLREQPPYVPRSVGDAPTHVEVLVAVLEQHLHTARSVSTYRPINI